MIDWYRSFSYIDRLIIMLISMIFLHNIADYLVQTKFIAKFKQRKNWEEYDTKGYYKYDYIVILLVHSFSWSIITFFPILFEFQNVMDYSIIVIGNTLIHAYIDDLKCNKLKINLIQDQLIHILQIVLIFILFVIIN